MALALERREGQFVVLTLADGRECEIEVVRLLGSRSGRVRLAVTAPADVRISRRDPTTRRDPLARILPEPEPERQPVVASQS